MYRIRLVPALAMFALAAILIPSGLMALTTFERTYGGTSDDCAYSVEQTVDSGYVLAGDTRSFGAGDYDAYLIKVDALGDTQWTRTYGGTGADGGYSVDQTSDGGYVLAGESFGPSRPHIYLVRTGANGDTQWTRTYSATDESFAFQVQQTADSGFIVAGYTYSTGTGDYNVYLIKTKANGDTLWTRTFGDTTQSERGLSVQQTTDSGYIVAGYKGGDVYLLKLGAAGNVQWQKTFGGTSAEKGASVQQTADGGYVVAGYTASYGAGQQDVYLVKTNASGDTLWTRTFGGSNDDVGSSVRQTGDGGYVITGYTDPSGTGDLDVYLVRAGATGDTLWTRTFGGGQEDIGMSALQTIDGGYAVAGYTMSFGAGGYDVLLIKTDSLGRVLVAAEEPKVGPKPAAPVIACSPNPCRGATVVSLKLQASSSKPVTLHVYDSQGRLVQSQFGVRVSSFPLDMRSMPAGTYFCQLEAGDLRASATLRKL